MQIHASMQPYRQPVRFGKKQTQKPDQSAIKAPKSKTRKWVFRSLLGATLVGGILGGIHVKNAIPVIHNTALNPAVSGPAYNSLSGTQKREMLWQQIEATRYQTLPDTNSVGVKGGTGLAKLDNFLKIFDHVYMRNTFDQTADVRPAHDKLFHPFGAVAKVKWVPKSGHPFTGMFAQPAQGLARLSLATNQEEFTPGVALKLMVDGGQPAVSTIAVPSLDPQASRDFFAQTASTRFPAPQGAAFKVINPILSKAGGVPTSNELPVDHFARMTPQGKAVDNPVAPYTLEFRPAQAHTDAQSKNDFRDDLAKIPAGTKLYEVWGKTADGKAYPVADLVTESPLVASRFGDQELSFQHPR